MPTFDFGLGSDNNSGNTNEPIKEPTTSLDDVNQNNNAKESSVLNSENNNNINPKGEEGDSSDDKSDKPNGDGQSDDSSLKEGSVVTVGEDSYTVDANGNLLDKDNNIFKSSNEVAEWLAQFETVDDDEDADAINLANIQKAIGIDLSDEMVILLNLRIVLKVLSLILTEWLKPTAKRIIGLLLILFNSSILSSMMLSIIGLLITIH